MRDAAPAASTRGGSTIAAFNDVTDIRQVLEAHGYRPSGASGFVRPGGDHPSVIVIAGQNRSLHFNTNDRLYSAAADGALHSQTPFSIICELDHNGDVRTAIRQVARTPGLERSERHPQARPALADLPRSHDHGADHYLTHAATALELGKDHAADPTWPYFEEVDGRGLLSLWMFQPPTRDVPRPPLQLCNFTARITEETEIDDGEQRVGAGLARSR